MAGGFVISKGNVVSSDSIDFIEMAERIRNAAAPEDADCMTEIFEAYDAGMMIAGVMDENERLFNAFYRAAVGGHESWLADQAIKRSVYFEIVESYWNKLLEMMRRDPRWQGEPAR